MAPGNKPIGERPFAIGNYDSVDKNLNQLRTPAVIIVASGMATGGRVLHHLKALAPNAQNGAR
jgi:predicted metal-dependent RNase